MPLIIPTLIFAVALSLLPYVEDDIVTTEEEDSTGRKTPAYGAGGQLTEIEGRSPQVRKELRLTQPTCCLTSHRRLQALSY
ncbi:hypothetical protein BD324DRAFT_680502 [Kockovaella imperatae]|uniref:Uncharacterized protein n=1 Tax=Kockovaella imperatae TaxID=4999 RepID=A0A1Y1UKD4_9TREE|nr:hypothetical protein BD324DRAFT_680502 [Kockovaella imperatae]ORX37585.1 hypothetical protein BD324DRAFT_680502 [Kockovaella imperatae]